MNAKDIKAIPEPTLRRLPRYYHYLEIVFSQGIEDISSTKIAKDLGLDPVQVRKDIQYTNILGRPKKGFNVKVLLKSISDFLNWNNTTSAFIAGAGNLGAALIGYCGFEKYGMKIIAAFDNDPAKIDKKLNDITILHTSKLTDLAKRMHIHIGVITTPASAAQEAADMMVKGGIKALWNFAPQHLQVPDDVIVENAQFSTSLAVLTRKLSETVEY